ncbi:hypothetical protein HELRODRAFT_161929 [Helobdella robusta]|uniref:Large ribosomal subunit protein mL37 n=1 Tax=Helobdella robusta TaxID=6412 RepID=T1ES18_HELRO|nr:hypothetical protein HELRODRAFT_161929 [Helobdella robusta]ESO02640.1 hypothetical protein HELRODRAFT_161929 [Helobdella robusta]
MKLTNCLYRQNYRWLFKTMWKFQKSKMNDGFLNKPLYLDKAASDRFISCVIFHLQGIPIVKGSELWKEHLPVFPKWQPSVADDIQFKPLPTIKDHPDYHETPAHEFNTDCQLVEGEKQALILTKSQPLYQLPQSVQRLIGLVDVPDQDELMQRVIMQANRLEPTKDKLPRRHNPDLPIWKFKAEYGIPDYKIAVLTVQNMLKICMSLVGCHPDLLTSRRMFSDIELSTFYHYNSKYGDTDIFIKGNTDAMIYASKRLDPFVGPDVIDQSISFNLPSIYPLSPTIDLKNQHVWKYENLLGYKGLGPFRHPHPHLMFLCYDDLWSSSQHNAKGLMFSFGYACALAKNIYGDDIKQLPQPISTQCVVTNGRSFNFVCFQLNTLDFEESPVKNLVWFDSDNMLFDKIIPKRAMLRHTKYENYSPEVLKKVIAMFINGADIKIDMTAKSADVNRTVSAA